MKYKKDLIYAFMNSNIVLTKVFYDRSIFNPIFDCIYRTSSPTLHMIVDGLYNAKIYKIITK
jgi:hypothetical protein